MCESELSKVQHAALLLSCSDAPMGRSEFEGVGPTRCELALHPQMHRIQGRTGRDAQHAAVQCGPPPRKKAGPAWPHLHLEVQLAPAHSFGTLGKAKSAMALREAASFVLCKRKSCNVLCGVLDTQRLFWCHRRKHSPPAPAWASHSSSVLSFTKAKRNTASGQDVQGSHRWPLSQT